MSLQFVCYFFRESTRKLGWQCGLNARQSTARTTTAWRTLTGQALSCKQSIEVIEVQSKRAMLTTQAGETGACLFQINDSSTRQLQEKIHARSVSRKKYVTEKNVNTPASPEGKKTFPMRKRLAKKFIWSIVSFNSGLGTDH